jgi:UPF0716 protein FxsA
MRLSWAKWLLLGILVLPIAEIVVFVAVAAQIGFADAVLIQLVCSLVGVVVIRSAGRVRLDRLRSQLGEGMIHSAQFDGADLVRAAAGVLLVVPGILTDAFGALLLVPVVRRALGAIVLRAAAATDGRRDQVIDLEPSEWQRQESGVRHQVSDVRRQGSARKPDAS